MENNKLIAEFMGGQRVLPDKDVYNMPTHNNLCYGVDELHYHTSWDWLMPVVEKILDISFQDEGDAEDFYSIRDCMPDLNHTYKAVVQFINQ